MTGQALVLQADALRLPLPDESVDLCIASPPYYRLRQYAAPNAIGLEDNPQEYLEALWAATAEMVRVLKPSGSIFIDLGDKYAERGGPERAAGADGGQVTYRAARPRRQGEAETGIRQKSLMLLPERYRVGCVDRLGLIARAVVCWSKVNGLPDSVNDRVRRSHEDVVHLTKAPRYYAALDTLREPHAARTWEQHEIDKRAGLGQSISGWEQQGKGDSNRPFTRQRSSTPRPHALGKLPGSVWTLDDGDDVGPFPFPWTCPKCGAWIPNAWRLGMHDAICDGRREDEQRPGSVWRIPSDPLRLPAWLGIDHYAAFPPELPRRLILGWSPPGICLECGQGRWPVVEHDRTERHNAGKHPIKRVNPDQKHGTGPTTLSVVPKATILGWACACTPSTLHPGTGESSGPPQAGGALAADGGGYVLNTGGKPRQTSHPGHAGLWDKPKVGPWREYHLDGWQPPPTRPAVVLDPFGGTGTTAMVARALGRIGLSFDLSHAYSRAARYRIFESGEWQQVIERTTGRRTRPLPKHDPAQPRLDLFAAAEVLDPDGFYRERAAWHEAQP